MALANFVINFGPPIAFIDSHAWNTYISGLVTSCGTDSMHYVQVVGITTKRFAQPAWIVRNGWGPDWGEHGLIYLAMNKNLCNIANNVTWMTC